MVGGARFRMSRDEDCWRTGMATATMRAAFITGGGSGIGRALARALAARGIAVCVADTNDAACEKGCHAVSPSVSLAKRLPPCAF